MEEIRLLAIDLDGTLLTNSKQLTDRSAKALSEAIRAGICVVPVTGRPMSGIPEAVLAVPGIRYVITSNGAVTSDLLSGKVLRMKALDRKTAEEIAEIPMERGLIHSVFIGGMGYCEQKFFSMLLDRFRGTPPESYVLKSRLPAEDIRKMIRRAENGVENIWMIARSRTERDEIDSFVRKNWPVQTVLTADRDVEIGSPEADKGMALLALAGSLGILKQGIMAFGDNENDLGMFEAAGVSVAMGNAAAAIRQRADQTADTNEAEGVAKLIEKLL